MPAAVVLWSPWADLTNAGDTAHMLEFADPVLAFQVRIIDILKYMRRQHHDDFPELNLTAEFSLSFFTTRSFLF